MKSIATVIITAYCGMAASAQTPTLLKDINAAGNSNSQFYTAYNNKTLFVANDGINGVEIWITDGTTAGTTLLKDINPGGNSDPYLDNFLINGKLLFSANNGTAGDELWVTDGSSGGTQMLKDIMPGASGSSPDFLVTRNGNNLELATLGGKVFFFAEDGINGDELWVTDGTTAGTQLLKDINPGSASAYGGSAVSNGVILNGKLYFIAGTAATGTELWVTDGTSAGTTLFKDLNPGTAGGFPSQLTLFGNGFIFSAVNNTYGQELWISDGTGAGTSMLKDINTGTDNSSPGWFQYLGNKIIFTATNNTNGREVWVTDGTSIGTQMLKDLSPGIASGIAGNVYTVGAYTYFLGTNGTDRSLYKTDGTEAGTTVVRTFDTDMNSATWFSPVEFDHKLYFQMKRTAEGWHLWKTDGTEAGTKIVAPDIAPNFSPLVNSGAMKTCNGIFFYNGNYTPIGDELYIIQAGSTSLEPTTANTAKVHIYPNPASLYIRIDGLEHSSQLTIYNQLGQIVHHEQSRYKEARIAIPDWPAGIYSVRIKYKDGSQSILKFLKA